MTEASGHIDDHVVLVNADGDPIGRHPRSLVHTDATPLHLAFSLYLFDHTGRVLLTRRALTKRTWPGVWTNTCCGHPHWAEPMEEAIQRRLGEELGVRVRDLVCLLPEFGYTARDASGIVENEICPVFAGQLHPTDTLRPNRDEVMEWVWVRWADLVTSISATPFVFSPWAVEQVAQLPGPPDP